MNCNILYEISHSQAQSFLRIASLCPFQMIGLFHTRATLSSRRQIDMFPQTTRKAEALMHCELPSRKKNTLEIHTLTT